METGSRIKKITFSLAIIGFIPALFLCAQTVGMGMKTDRFKSISSNVIGSNLGISTIEEMASIYGLISACFFLFIILSIMRDKFFLELIGMIPLSMVVIQYGFLLLLKTGLFKVNWDYSSWLEISYYIDLISLILAVILITLQMYLVRMLYNSFFYNNH